MARHYKPMSAAGRDARADRKRAEAEARGEPVRTDEDFRTICTLDLRGAGGPLLTLEPRRGYVSWRARDEAGAVVDCAAIKQLLHGVADRLTRMQSPWAR